MKTNFIVLACSFKHGGRCVAGIDLTSKKLIRLISNDEKTNYAIPKQECYALGRMLCPLDIIEIDIVGKAPNNGAQTENYFVDFPLVKGFKGRAIENDIKPYRYKGDNSIYPFGTKAEFLSSDAYYYRDHSLCLIPAYSLSIKTVVNSKGDNKTKISFDVYKFNKEKITLTGYSVTDPRYIHFEDSTRQIDENIGKAWLLISLGQEEGDLGDYYKYVSGIIDVSKSAMDFIPF